MKRIFSILIMSLLLISLLPINTFANSPYKLFVDGQQIQTDCCVINNCIYFPVKPVAKALGVTENSIIWNDIDQSVTVIKDCNTINSNIFVDNGNQIQMTHAPIIINGSIYAPINYMSKAYSYQINLDTSNNAVVISMKPEIKEFIGINNEVNSTIIQIDNLLQKDQISNTEMEAIKIQVYNTSHKLELWGELFQYYSIKNMYFKTLKDGLSACFYKNNINNPEFNLITETMKKNYENYHRDYNFDKNEIKAERIRLQKLNYL